MHAVARIYSGSGARDLFDLLVDRSEDVEAAMRGIPGFVAYTLFRTEDGGISVTVCSDPAGTDESLQRARAWVQENAGDLRVSPPEVRDGEVILQLS